MATADGNRNTKSSQLLQFDVYRGSRAQWQPSGEWGTKIATRSRVRRLLAAVVVTILVSDGFASAQTATLISSAELQKILRYVDTIGSKKNFPGPTAQSLGLSKDPGQALPVTVIMTDDHRVYFCRSDLNQNDYIILARMPGNGGSYMFSTNANFALGHALYLPVNDFPRVENINSSQTQDLYKRALTELTADINKSRAH